MKRDFDLIRIILQESETIAPGEHIQQFEPAGFQRDIANAHAVLLVEAGLLAGTISRPLSSPPFAIVTGLTWAGHDFLDSVKDDTLWAKAKKNVIAPTGGVALSVLIEWAKSEAKTRLGIP